MPKIKPEDKRALQEAGRWGDFVERRQVLKEGGLSPSESHKQGLVEFLTVNTETAPTEEISEPVPSEPLPPDFSPIAESSSLPSPVPVEPEAEKKASPPARAVPSKPAAPTELVSVARDPVLILPALPPVRRGEFDGKKASEVQAIRWVADNMEVLDPCSDECPSSAAWGLLASCRKSPSAKADFWRNTFTKLMPSRAAMEKEEAGSAGDLSRAADVIEELLRFGRESRDEVEKGSSGSSSEELDPGEGQIVSTSEEVKDLPDDVEAALAEN